MRKITVNRILGFYRQKNTSVNKVIVQGLERIFLLFCGACRAAKKIPALKNTGIFISE